MLLGPEKKLQANKSEGHRGQVGVTLLNSAEAI